MKDPFEIAIQVLDVMKKNVGDNKNKVVIDDKNEDFEFINDLNDFDKKIDKCLNQDYSSEKNENLNLENKENERIIDKFNEKNKENEKEKDKQKEKEKEKEKENKKENEKKEEKKK